MTVFIIDETITSFSSNKTSLFLSAIEERNIEEIKQLIVDPHLPKIIKKLALQITTDRIENLIKIIPSKPIYKCRIEMFSENKPLRHKNSEIRQYREIFTLIQDNIKEIPNSLAEATPGSVYY